ncbi:T9SS protein PorZ precursor [Tenacibaculum xiamenense]
MSFIFEIKFLNQVVQVKKILPFFLLFFNITLFSQVDYSDSWEDLFSYSNVKDFTKEGNFIYALADNAVFIYNAVSNETSKISSIHGLSGGTTSALHYSSSLERLVIGYEDGLLEVVNNDGKITKSPEITNFNQTGEKRINHIYEFNNKLYLATPFAIVVYDIERLEFGDTYFIGFGSSDLNINQITVNEGQIYAATENGIYIADVNNPNLIDFNNWTQTFTGNFTNISVFDNQVFASRGNELLRIQGSNISTVRTFPENIIGIKSSNNSITIALSNTAVVLNTGLGVVKQITANTNFNFQLNEAYEENGDVYLGTTTFGILKTFNGSTFQEIHPEGPMFNDIFSMDVHNSNLWLVYGGYNVTYTPSGNRKGFSHFNGQSWNNYPYDPNTPFADLVSVNINKNEESSVFISSFGDITGAQINTPLTGGLLNIQDGQVQNFYNQLNSPLEDIVEDIPNRVTIRVSGSAFDRQGNLWVTNIGVSQRLKKLSASGQWTGYDIESIINFNKIGLNEIEVDRFNNVWIGTRGNGLLAYNENGDRKEALIAEVNRGDLPSNNVRTIGVDRNNRIWIGTSIGLVVFNNASGIFDSNINNAEPVVILDEGIPKKLLGDQTINSIEIDGGDNKWFGTETGGVLYTNPSGETTLAAFNKDNSPLPSNKIVKIKVDDITGKVYFATSRGMVAYKSGVVPFGEGLEEVYAYPNPALRKHDVVTIDGRNGSHLPKGTNVKILDVSGNLVFETNVVEGQQLGGGKVTWNKRNLAGTRVASGIYIVLLSNEDNTESATTKIAIVN